MTPPTLVTVHLLLRPIQIEDAEALHPLYHDPVALRFWHTTTHPTIATTRKHLTSMLLPAACSWSICRRIDEQPIGIIHYLDMSVPRPGMGYIIHPDYRRQGLMTEATRAVLDYVSPI